MSHDPLCEHHDCHPVECIPMPDGCPDCDLIVKVRADERERAAQRVADPDLHEAWCDLSRPHGPAVCDCYHAACIAAARGEAQ